MKPVIGDHPDVGVRAGRRLARSRPGPASPVADIRRTGVSDASDQRSSVPPDPRAAAAGRREASASAILRAVLKHGPAARSTIARLAGLSPASMTAYCAELIELGLLCDLPERIQSGGPGRPHLPVGIDTARHVVGAVHVAVPHVTVAVLDLRGRILTSRRVPHRASSAAETVRHAARCLLDQLSRHGRGAASLGVGVACGGWVDQETGTVVEHAMLGWSQVRIGDLLRAYTGLPVHVDGHSRALLHGERLFGAARGARSVLHLFAGNVVEAAFALDDAAHYGPRSRAGLIAHLPLTDSAEHCPCGRTGCFQVSVSERTVSGRAVETGVLAEPDFPALLTAARTGDEGAAELLVERARLVGQGAAMLIDVFDPELVVVAEQAVAALPPALAALRAEITARARTRIDAATAVVPSSFAGDTLAVAGGSAILDVLYRNPLAVVSSPRARLPRP